MSKPRIASWFLLTWVLLSACSIQHQAEGSADAQIQYTKVVLPVELDNPRGLSLDQHGALYLVDSGDPSIPFSGKVGWVDDGGMSIRNIRFGNSVGDASGEAYLFGVSDVASRIDGLYIVTGISAWLESPLYAPNKLMFVTADDEAVEIFDAASFEVENDPDGRGPDSNAMGVALGSDGHLWVSDAAGNWVAHLNEQGQILTVVAFPAVNGEDAVPTGIAIDSEGNAYVALFRCQSPTDGKGGIARISSNGEYVIMLSSLSNPIDVNFGPSGALHVLEFAIDYAPNTGRLSRVDNEGNVTTLVDGLNYPTSFVIDDAGSIYVTEMASPSGGEAGSGKLLRFDPVQ